MLETLCPVWNGIFGGIVHVNTCSVDNIIALLSLSHIPIQKVYDVTESSQIPDAELFFQLIRNLQFDEPHDLIAKLINIPISYELIVQKYDFIGVESKIIHLLRRFNICNDKYYSTLQCFHCCSDFTTKVHLGNLTNVTSTLQNSIDGKFIPKNVKSVRQLIRILSY